MALRLLGSSGNRATLFRTLAPRSRATVTLAAGGEAPENDFATVVESTQPVVVDRTMTWDSRRYGAHAETSIEAPATTWYLAEGATHGNFDLFYLLLNASGVDATATVKYLRPSPLPPIVKTYTVPANGRKTIWVDDEGPDLAETDVSAVITSDQPIVVERAMYASANGVPFAAGHDGVGVRAPARAWFLAEGATGGFFDLYVLIANPGPSHANVKISYLLPGGGVYEDDSIIVQAESRLTIHVDDQAPILNDTAVSMIVTALNDQPIVVERAMWWPSPNWYEAHLAAGTTETGTRWALADGEIGSAAGEAYETYILIANTGDRRLGDGHAAGGGRRSSGHPDPAEGIQQDERAGQRSLPRRHEREIRRPHRKQRRADRRRTRNVHVGWRRDMDGGHRSRRNEAAVGARQQLRGADGTSRTGSEVRARGQDSALVCAQFCASARAARRGSSMACFFILL